jgi:hypothetical protein
MTKDQLSAIRERLDAATPGPWEAGTAACCPDMGWVDGPKGAVCPQFTATKVTHSLDANDADLIAHAPTDLRALLDEVERLTKREDELVKAGLDLMVANKDLTAEAERLTTELDAVDSDLQLAVNRLTAEVERLTAENDRLCLAVPRIIQVNDPEADRAFDALQPSLGTPVPPERRIRRQADVDAAFARGAEAMRTSLLQRVSWGSDLADRIRDEPVPEDR